MCLNSAVSSAVSWVMGRRRRTSITPVPEWVPAAERLIQALSLYAQNTIRERQAYMDLVVMLLRRDTGSPS